MGSNLDYAVQTSTMVGSGWNISRNAVPHVAGRCGRRARSGAAAKRRWWILIQRPVNVVRNGGRS